MCLIIQWLRSCLLKRRRHRSLNWTRKDNEKESKVPWDSLYNMTKREATSVVQDINRTLNKQFIQVSNSFAAVSVLFIQKSEDELVLWTTVTWTESLKESLSSFIDIWDSAKHWMSSMIHQVECHRHFTRFNCCRDKWKMTFYTRYELYEWMMTSFELVNVSSTFQRYINWVLQNF
jgi:hypothetical protein